MDIELIDIGSTPDDGTGDPNRDAFEKTNTNAQRIKEELGKKAPSSELANYATKEGLSAGLSLKANQDVFDILALTVSLKADKDAVKYDLKFKADQVDLEALELDTVTSVNSLQERIDTLDSAIDDHETRITALEAGGGSGSIDVDVLAGDGLESVNSKLKVKAGSGVTVSASGVSLKLSQNEQGNSNSGLALESQALKVLTDDTLEVSTLNKLKVSALLLDLIASKASQADVDKKLERRVGDHYYSPFGLDELAKGEYVRNGDNYPLSSPQGQALQKLKSGYKANHGVIESEVGGVRVICLPNAFMSGKGTFTRAVDGVTRKPGSKELDATQKFTGTLAVHVFTGQPTTGVFLGVGTFGGSGSAGGAPNGPYGYGIDNSRQVRTSTEERPINEGGLPIIYLGV